MNISFFRSLQSALYGMIGFVALSALAEAPDSSGAGLIFEKEVFEFTVGYDEASKEFDLHFRNGKAPLNILGVETSCTCMTVSVAEKRIEAGDTGKIHCVFKVPNALGVIQKPVILKTDLLGQRDYIVQVRVEMPAILRFEPARLSWKIGEPITEKAVRITVAEGNKVAVKSVECSRDVFEWTLGTINEGEEYELRIRPKQVEQQTLGMFLVHTDSAVQRQKSHSFYAVVEQAKTVP